jgi:hypothetical protein
MLSSKAYDSKPAEGLQISDEQKDLEDQKSILVDKLLKYKNRVEKKINKDKVKE